MRSLILALCFTTWTSALNAQTPAAPTRPVNAFYELRSDGAGWKKLFEVTAFYPCNSPRLTVDGSRIAFDAWTSREGETLTDAHVLTCRLDGSDLTDLGPGSMPSWRPDGKQIAYCRYQDHQGVWVMDADGKNAKLIDRTGWGIQWSPTGESVSYTRANQVIIRNVEMGDERPVFPGNGSPYGRIYWNMTWSPDGAQLAFMADLEDKRELAIVDARGAEYGFRRRVVGNFNPMLSWNPDLTRLVFPERIDSKTMRLSELDPFQMGDSRPVSGIPSGQRVASACWMPDGSKLLVLVTEP